jgi:hypothetical protein
MDITGVTGLTEMQQETLKMLGAIGVKLSQERVEADKKKLL